MDTLGVASVVKRLADLNSRFPGRFEPAPILVQMAEANERFYPAEGKPVR
jgi:3-hydroxyacyl-CoA dehydrogenase/enoyl-CoA hydratase/3-hydroxybutyryl-CoA epimerase